MGMAIAGAIGRLARRSIKSSITQNNKWVFDPFNFSQQILSYSSLPLPSSSSSSSWRRQLILYSKPGCCLCDELKQHLQAALSSHEPLQDVHLEVRDITCNPEWERAYRYEIPVLARVGCDGIEERLPRLSTRAGTEYIQMQVEKALNQHNVR